MFIQWLNQSCFKITVKSKASNHTIILTDPYTDKNGSKKINLNADIVTISSPQDKQLISKYTRGTTETPQPFVIKSAGEYEVNDVFIYGVNNLQTNNNIPQPEDSDSLIYIIKAENITLTHFRNPWQKELSPNQLELIENTDILLISIDEQNPNSNSKAVPNLISQIEPRIIIPMQYEISQLNNNSSQINKFIKEMGINSQKLNKLNINKKNLPTDKTELIILTGQNK